MPVPNQKVSNHKPTFSLASAVLLSFSLLAGQLLPLNSSQTRTAAHEMKQPFDRAHDAKGHAHKPVEVPVGQPVPTVNLVVRPDAMKGWNLEVKVSNFTFAPERVNTKSTSVNEGHAHLYVNGKKISRLYGTWYHLESLPPGTHNVTVSLNTNDHGELTHQGKPIQAAATIQVSK